MNCLICFERKNKNDIQLSCCNKHCNSIVCSDCIISFIKYSVKENQMIMCPDINCKSLILHSEIEKLPIDIRNMYYITCVSYIKNINIDSINKIQSLNNAVEKLRAEKLTFITKEYPKAITSIIKIAMKNSLNKTNKNNKAKIQEILQNNKKCFNILCNGTLNSNYECITCEIVYCKICEIKKTDNHTCKQDDIDSLTFINSLVKCPKCKFPVIRSYGCDMITCSVCRTHFNYNTGEQTTVGNHNAHEQFVVKKNLTLNDRYNGLYSSEIMILLIKIQDYLVVEISIDSVINLILKQEENKKVSKKFEMYILNKTKRKHFIKCIEKIEELHNDKKINILILDKILETFK